MGGVNTAYDYYTLMGFGHKGPDGEPVVDNALLQGGIVSVYYLGTLIGCLIGGSIGDRYGRIKTIFVGAAVATVGACLQCSAMNHEWMICARLVNGWGTGILNSIIPVWATETAEHTSRGQFIAIEFTLNIFGVVIAYWLEYACSFYGDGTSSFIWRFPVAFQIPMLLGLMGGVLFFPEVRFFADEQTKAVLLIHTSHPDGSSRSVAKRKVAMSWLACVAIQVQTRRKRKPSSRTLLRPASLSAPTPGSKVTTTCSLASALANFTPAGASSWLSGFKSCRSGSALLVSPSTHRLSSALLV